MTDRLAQLIKQAFDATVEAEKIAHAGGITDEYHALLEAHSALLRAKNLYRSRRAKDTP